MTERADRPRPQLPHVDSPWPHPDNPALVHRFNGAERALHWLMALDITLLALSGLGLYLPPPNPVLDRRELMRTIHIDGAIGLFLIPILIAGIRPGSMGRLWREVEWFDADDWRWLRRIWIPAFLRGRRPLPPQGRMNAGQKINTLLVAAALAGFAGTGSLMYLGSHIPPSLSDAADTWHIWLMSLGAPLIAGHLALALLVPSTRGSLRGIVTGFVRRDYAERRHHRWMHPRIEPHGSAPACPEIASAGLASRTGDAGISDTAQPGRP